MMPIGWSSAKKKVGIGRLIDWLGFLDSACGCFFKILPSPRLTSELSHCLLR